MRKNKKFNRIVAGVLALGIVAGAIGIGAYLSDTEVKKDVYTVGNVQAEIVAVGDMELDNVGALLPGTVHQYERAAMNTGINDAYVFMSLTIPYEMVGVSDTDGTQIGERVRQLFIPGVNGGYIGSEWKLVDVGYIGQYEIEDNGQYCGEHDQYSAVVGDTITYVYGYIGDNADGSLKALASGETTSNLVETMQLTNLYHVDKIDGEVSTKLYAIQSANVNGGLTDVNGVWAVINKALNGDQEAATLTYSITNTRSGEAVSHAPLKLVNDNGQTVAFSVANENGNGQFQNVPTGTYTIETEVGELSINSPMRTFGLRRSISSVSIEIEDDKTVDINLTTPQNTLVKGSLFNKYLTIEEDGNYKNVAGIEFIKTSDIPADAFDVSEAQDGSVMAWYETADLDWYENTILYIVSRDGEKIYANPNADTMFNGGWYLLYINTDNFDTSGIYDGDELFGECSNLTNTLSDFDLSNMRKFEYGFRSCDWLTEYTIPEGVTVIPAGAFYQCSNLITLNIPASVKVIIDPTWDSPLENTFSLEAINVNPANEIYSSIDGVLFNKDKTILLNYPRAKTGSSYTIPEGVTTIGERAFFENQNLNNIDFSSTVTIIEPYAFSSISFNSIEIPGTVKVIGDYAFFSCGSTQAITIHNGVEEIGKAAFSYMRNIQEINIPASVKKIAAEAFHASEYFKDTVFFTTINVDPANEYYTSVNGVLFTKDMKTLVQYPTIRSNTSYVVPEGVEVIGESAFLDVKYIKSITLPSTLKTINKNAFSQSGLTSITIPEGVEFIGNSAFARSSLTTISLPSTLKVIDDNAFSQAGNLASVVLPTNLEYVGDYAFSQSKLTSITIPQNVKEIGGSAFYSCRNLTSVVFKCSDFKIGNRAFGSTPWLQNQISSSTNGVVVANGSLIDVSGVSGHLSIPNTVTTIGEYGIAGNNITSITIPSSVSFIGFSPINCNNLTTINVDPANEHYTSVDGVLFTKDMKTLITYPRAKTGSSYTIPEGVETVVTGACSQSKYLTSVIIPKSVKRIEAESFSSSTIETVYYTGTEEQWNAIDFLTDEYGNSWISFPHPDFEVVFNYIPE